MAVLARLWFHYCPASGWVLAERTGLGLRLLGDVPPRPSSFKQNRRDLMTQDS
jgi:hypothetical protein